MIRLNGNPVQLNHFPDGTLLLKEKTGGEDVTEETVIRWNYENNEELLAIYFLSRHLRAAGCKNIVLDMPYIPNARQDRVKSDEDVFTLKYFAELINSLSFAQVRVLDAHSNVSLALIDNVKQMSPKPYIQKVINKIEGGQSQSSELSDDISQGEGLQSNLLLFYPDEGAGKRYSEMIKLPYCFGIKKREWETGQIKGLDVSGDTDNIKGKDILIIDDICSFGGTFLHSAKKLKEFGAGNIYLFVSHLETSVFEGELLKTDYIKKIYTTDSIFKEENVNEKIEIVK